MSGDNNRRRRIGAALVLVLSLVVSGVGVAAAQEGTPQPIEENATYYDNENTSTNSSEWVPGDGNATAGGMLEMISRIPGMFIGSGTTEDPSGDNLQWVLFTGLVVSGATLFAVVGAGVGPIAGSMLGMVLAYTLTAVGIIPVWIRPLLLFTLVGIPASAAILRVFRR